MHNPYELPAPTEVPPLPRSFISRRLHSFAGLFIVCFLVFHLFVNSLSALFARDDGQHFIALANSLESLPYLQAFEILLLAVPFAIHAWLGAYRLFIAQPNAMPSDGSRPALPYSRNMAYTFQLLTALILVVGVVWHVVAMRFVQAPKEIGEGFAARYSVRLTSDPGLAAVAERLRATLHSDGSTVLAVTENAGTAMLLMVRDTFKSVPWCILFLCNRAPIQARDAHRQADKKNGALHHLRATRPPSSSTSFHHRGGDILS